MQQSLERIRPEEVKAVVFNGGGVKGAAHVTSYAGLLACGVDPTQIKDAVGTSIGSFIAISRAVGYNVDEMFDIMNEMNFEQFLDDAGGKNTATPLLQTISKFQNNKSGAIAALPALAKSPVMLSRIGSQGGIYKGDALRIWLERIIYEKTKIPYCTYQELFELAQTNPNMCRLHIVQFNKNTNLYEIHNHLTNPNGIISCGGRASSAIPGFFASYQPRIKVNGKPTLSSDDWYIDGGVATNYKINLFDQQPNGDEIFNRSVIGFKLTSSEEAAYLFGTGSLPDKPSLPGLKNFASSTIKALDSVQKNDFLSSPKDVARTIPIDNVGIGTLDFNIKENPVEYNKLLESGWNSSCRYFNKVIPFPEKYIYSPKLTSLDSTK
jgi:predicted acylesterase/phospholipase RssA